MTQPDYNYSDYSVPDPPHQPMYLNSIVKLLRGNGAVRRVLDAGCGDGNFTQSLSEAGFQMYGMDLSEGGVLRAKERYPACHFAKFSVYDDYREAFPQVTSFDAIVSVAIGESKRFFERWRTLPDRSIATSIAGAERSVAAFATV
jgi:SAM-dependent methyltransferase